jgi:hypothetical protein
MQSVHPARSLFLGYAAAGEPGSPVGNEPVTHYLEKGMPPWLAGAIHTGTVNVRGKEFPQIQPTRAISPVSTPWELLSTLSSRPGAATFAEMLSPGLQEAFHVASRQSPYGRDVGSYGEALKQAGDRLLPDYGLARDLMHPHSGGMYPQDATRLGRLERASRVIPIAVDPEQAYKARQREGMVSPDEALQHHITQFVHDAHSVGLDTPPNEVLDELRLKTDLDSELHAHAEDADGKFDYKKAAKIAARMYDQRHGGHLQEQIVDSLRTTHEAQARYNALRRNLYPHFARWDRVVGHRIDAKLEAAR